MLTEKFTHFMLEGNHLRTLKKNPGAKTISQTHEFRVSAEGLVWEWGPNTDPVELSTFLCMWDSLNISSLSRDEPWNLSLLARLDPHVTLLSCPSKVIAPFLLLLGGTGQSEHGS